MSKRPHQPLYSCLCQACGGCYTARRAHSLYCGPACRKAGARGAPVHDTWVPPSFLGWTRRPARTSPSRR